MNIGMVLSVVVVALVGLVWLVYLLLNALRVMKVMKLEGRDKPDNRGWIVWGISVASLFTGCSIALMAWVAMEWVLRPLDPFEDSLGTIQLFSAARSNIAFVIGSNVLILVIVFAMYQST